MTPLSPLSPPGRGQGEGPRGEGPRGEGPPALRLDNVCRSFGGLQAVDGVTLEVRPGERRALIGPNGAGKTTLFNVITGQLAPTGGGIRLEGTPIDGLSPHAVARRGISRSFQRNNLFPKLAVGENLRLAAAARAPGTWDLLGSLERRRGPIDRAREVAEIVGLADRLGGSCSWTSPPPACRPRRPSA